MSTVERPTVQFDKWTVLDELDWEPHYKQAEVVSSNVRNRVVAGGRRSGKSNIGGHELIPEAMFTRYHKQRLRDESKRREFWIVGPEYSDAEKEFRVLWDQAVRLELPMDKPGSYNDPIGGNMHFSLWEGAFQVHAKSARHPETLVGEGLSGVIMVEAAKIKEHVWTKFIRPTLADFNGWSLHTSTPEGRNWFYDNWKRGQDPGNIEWQSWRFPSWVNPYVYKGRTRTADVIRVQEWLANTARVDRAGTLHSFIESEGLVVDDEILSLMLDLTEESFNQEIGADFTEFVGRVFKGFDEDLHVRNDLQFQPDWDTVAAVDYGFTNPNVWLLIQVGPWGDINVLDEVYEPGLTADEFAHEIHRRGLCPGGTRTFYPDPADPGSTKQLEKILRVRHSGGTGGELKHRLDAIRSALKFRPAHLPDGHPDKKPQILFSSRCVETIRDMNQYRYPEKRSEVHGDKENPKKVDDHAPEALGRFFAAHFGTPATRAGRTKSHKAAFRNKR